MPLTYAAEERPAPGLTYTDAAQPQARAGSGVWDALVSGYEGSATGLALRGRLPDVVLDRHHATWYEKALESASGTVSEFPEMAVGGAIGLSAGAAAGGAVAGPPGAVVGGLLGTGAGMFAVPTAIRESLIQAYTAGDADSSADFLTRTGIVLKATGKSAAVGAATLGLGGVAGRLTGNVVAPMVGSTLTAQTAGRVALGSATGAEVGTMVVAPAALEGRLPEPQDFVNAAIVVGGMKAAGRVAGKISEIYARTGVAPEQVAADAKAEPKLAEELKAEGDDIPDAYQPLAVAEAVRNAFPGDKAEAVLDRPYADLPDTKLPYQVNLRYINGPDEVKGLLTSMAETYAADINAQRGGTQGWEATEAKAAVALNDLTGGEGAKVVTEREPGTAANAVELKIRGDMLMQASVDAAAAVKKYNEAKTAGTATDQMKLDALAAIHRSAMIQAEFTGASAETGRALQYLQKIKELRLQGERIGELVEMYGKDPDMLLRMAGDMDTPAGMAKFAKDAAKATKWEMVIEAYKAGIIGPISQMANIMGNTTFLAFHDVVDAMAALRPGGEMRAAEIPARLLGELQGAYEGLKIAGAFLGDSWKQAEIRHPIESVMRPLRALDKPATKMEQHRQAIPGDLGVLVRSLSFPWLSVADGAARLVLERREINALAARKAANDGYGNPFSREFRERVAENAQNLTIAEQAEVAAYVQRGVFQNPLGRWGKDLQSVVARSKVGPLFIPFMQTPSNVFKEMARLTPLSAPFVEAWQAAWKEGGAARDRAVAEVVLGSAVMGMTSVLAFDGERITGFGPPEPDKRRAWLETHQPYSVRVGTTYYDYSRIQPIGTLIGLAADMGAIWKHMTPEEQDKLPKMVAIAFSQAVTNQVWLKGMVDIMRGVAEADRYGPKIAQNLAAGMLPASGWLGQTAQIMDPYVREVNTIMEAIRNKIPGVREGLEPMVSGLTGEPVKNKERLGVVLPIKMSGEITDPVLLEAARLGVGVGKAPKNIELPAFGDRHIGKVELTPEQKTLFSTAAGAFAHTILMQIVESDNWENVPDLAKKRVFDQAIEASRKVGRSEALKPEQRAAEALRISNEISARLQQ